MSEQAQDQHAVPLHIIGYVDSRLREHASRIEKVLREHIADETGRFQSIHDAVEASSMRSEARHVELVTQIAGHLQRQTVVEDAFLRTDHGQLDVRGHRDDHYSRKRASLWWAGVKGNAVAKSIEWSVVAVLAWVGFSLWRSFLKGPL